MLANSFALRMQYLPFGSSFVTILGWGFSLTSLNFERSECKCGIRLNCSNNSGVGFFFPLNKVLHLRNVPLAFSSKTHSCLFFSPICTVAVILKTKQSFDPFWIQQNIRGFDLLSCLLVMRLFTIWRVVVTLEGEPGFSQLQHPSDQENCKQTLCSNSWSFLLLCSSCCERARWTIPP